MDNNLSESDTIYEGIKLLFMALVTVLAMNISQIISTIFGFLSICYLLWKWRQDYLKVKKENQK
jgi:hypothetical protein